MTRRKATAAFAIASYLVAVLVVPVWHRLHHLAHGADHVHTALGTVYDAEPTQDAGHFHAEFDRVFSDLGLAEVASAGTLTVDCAYTDLTLATCDGAATADHPRTFGDDLLARSHEHPHAPEDADHGAGSPEHVQASWLAVAQVSSPPPMVSIDTIFVPVPYEAPTLPFLSTNDARGPPRSSSV